MHGACNISGAAESACCKHYWHFTQSSLPIPSMLQSQGPLYFANQIIVRDGLKLQELRAQVCSNAVTAGH